MVIAVNNKYDLREALQVLDQKYDFGKFPNDDEQLLEIRRYLNGNKKKNKPVPQYHGFDYCFENDVGKTIFRESSQQKIIDKVYEYFKGNFLKKRINNEDLDYKVKRKQITDALKNHKTIIYDHKMYKFVRYERNSSNIRKHKYKYLIYFKKKEIKTYAFSLSGIIDKLYNFANLDVSKGFLQSRFTKNEKIELDFGYIIREKVVM